MEKLEKLIKQISEAVSTTRALLENKSFADYREDHMTQGKILEQMKLAQDGCFDLGQEIFKHFKWRSKDTLEGILEHLQEKGVIDSDLVDQMIAMYRLRSMNIIEKLDEEDYQKVDAIIRLNFEDIELFLEEVQEFLTSQNQL